MRTRARRTYVVAEEGVEVYDDAFASHPRVVTYYSPILLVTRSLRRARLMRWRAWNFGYITARVVEVPPRPDR